VVRGGRCVCRGRRGTHFVAWWREVGGMAVLGAIRGRGFVVVNSQGETKDRDANASARCTELEGLAHGGLVGASG
jgi:hypothetical protein